MTLQGGVASRCARKRGSIVKVFKMASKVGDNELETKIICLKLRRTCKQDFVRGNELQKHKNDVKSKTSENVNIRLPRATPDFIIIIKQNKTFVDMTFDE